MTKRSKPPVTALKLALFPFRPGGSKRAILTPLTGPCRALLCIFLGAAGPRSARTAPMRSPAERKMGRTGHWAARPNIRHYGGRASGPPELERTGRLLRVIRTRGAQSAGWLTEHNGHRNERKRMDAGAPQDASHHASGQGDHESPALAGDPISQLELEIERTEHSPPASTAETERLLEETWSVFTECLVIRDGLLEACDEIERAMGGLQRKLGGLPVAIEPNAHSVVVDARFTHANATPNGNGNHVHTNGAAVSGHANDASANAHSNGSSAG